MGTDWKQVGKYAGIGLTIAAGFVGALFTGMAMSYGWGKDVGLGDVERTRSDLADARRALAVARAEIGDLKVQLASTQRQSGAVQVVQVRPEAGASAADNPFLPKASAKDLRVAIKQGASAELFGGDLIIAVSGIDFGGAPLRNRVDLTILAAGTSKKVAGGDVGQRVEAGRYEVTILAVDALQATFRVRLAT